jgi:(p)ppGpp synthase/HD superfamily hydrolase
MSLIEKARIFATEAHGANNQRRKYTNLPYITHPQSVVAILRSVGITDQATLCAAWMHDVLEDCPGVASCEIGVCFSPEIEHMVVMLTDTPAGRGLNRARRKAIDRVRLSCADHRVQSIKVADLIDNSSTIAAFDPEFAKIYMAEKEALMKVLQKAHLGLQNRAIGILDAYYETAGAA